MLCLFSACSAATGAQSAESTAAAAERWETWTGFDATGNSWFAYSGLVYAPFGAATEPGWRLRAEAGSGRYHYDGTRPGPDLEPVPVLFRGRDTIASALVGYQARWENTLIKVYAGAAYALQTVRPFDPGNAAIGEEVGAKGVIETWTDLSSDTWLAFDLSYTTAFDDYHATARAGVRLAPGLSAGVEVGALGNRGYDALRAGASLGLDTPVGQVTATGGVSGDYEARTGPYGGVSLFARF